jgi:hypothetical protein
VYGIAENVEGMEDVEIQLEGVGPEGNNLSFKLNINLKEATKGDTIHKLAAKQILRYAQKIVTNNS